MSSMHTPKLAVCAIVAGLLYQGIAVASDMSRTSRYFNDATGNPIFLVGYYGWASVAPGYYIDQPAQYANMINQGVPYKLNYLRISLGINRFTSTTNPPSWDGRPTPVPFKYINNKADLNQWDDTFWDGLRYHCELARQKGVFVHVAFFDGVAIRGGSEAYRWAGSFWNVNNQTSNFFGNLDSNGNGDADENGEFYRLNDFINNTGVGYYQRQLIEKTLAETAAYDNVFYEIGNELIGAPSTWYEAVTNYVKARTNKPITQNDGARSSNTDGWADHSGNDPAAIKSKVAAGVGQGYPWWDDPDGSALGDGTADNLRRAAWYSFAGGAAAWGGFTCDLWDGFGGFDPAKASYYRNLMLFIESSGGRFWEMVPAHNLVSNNNVNSCIANSGSEYVAYILNSSSATLNLSEVSGNAYYRLYDPRTGVWTNEQSVAGGGTRSFNRPTGAEDWVIHVYLVHASQATFGPVTNLGSGTQPHCASGLGGTLHVVYVSGDQVQYRTMTGGVPSAAETLPGSGGGKNPFVVVGMDGSVHVVWDTWSNAYYTNRVGGFWKNPQTLPYTYTVWNWFAQVAVDPNGVAYTSHWSVTHLDPGGGHNIFCRVTNTGSATPTITKIYQEVSFFRPPCILGPSPASAGTGNIHIFIGQPQTLHRTMDYNGNVSGAVNISRTPHEKTAEGLQAFFIGSDPAIATGWFSGNDDFDGPLFNSLSRANASKQGLVVDIGASTYFPRAAYDPTDNMAFVLYPKANKPTLAYWFPQQDTTTIIGHVSESTLSTAPRGPGAGGVARNVDGGVHIVYSTGSQVYHRTWGTAPDTQPPSVPTNVQAAPISWNSISVMWTASTDNIGVAGYKIYRNGNPQPIGTSPTPGYTDTGLQPETTYSYRVSAYDDAQNESGQSSPPAVTATLTRYALADFDQDGDVDLEDFGLLQRCYSIVPVTGACIATDLNSDGFVNLTDFDIFRNCMSRANSPADPDCWNP